VKLSDLPIINVDDMSQQFWCLLSHQLFNRSCTSVLWWKDLLFYRQRSCCSHMHHWC